MGIIIIGISVGGSIGDDLWLGFEVPKNEESGEGSGEEDENEPERTHLGGKSSPAGGETRGGGNHDLMESEL